MNCYMHSYAARTKTGSNLKFSDGCVMTVTEKGPLVRTNRGPKLNKKQRIAARRAAALASLQVAPRYFEKDGKVVDSLDPETRLD